MPTPRVPQRIGPLIAAAAGWKLALEQAPPARCVIIGAPHPSSWDLALPQLGD